MRMRVWVLLLSLTMMLVVVAACGDDDSDDTEAAESDTAEEVNDDPTATPEPEPTATATPEPTDEPEPTEEDTEAQDEDSEPADEGESQEEGGDADEESEPAEGEQSSGELGHLLLSIDDVPADWTQSDLGEATVEDAEFDDLADDPFEAPCGIEPIDEAYEPVAEGQATFQGTEMGPFLTHGVAQLDSADDAAEALDYMRTLFDCEEWIETDEMGEEIVFEINESDIADVGDDAVSVRISFSMGDEPEMEMFGDIGFDMVFFRRGEYVDTLMFFDLFGMSEADFPSLVQRADEKLQAGI